MRHVVVGAGPVGWGTAELLAAGGDEVVVVTRSGQGPRSPGIELVAADAADPCTMGRLARGAEALYNCANPAYHRWLTDWPPLAASMLGAAQESGAVLVTTSNLYGYGPGSRPMTEDTPLAATGTKGRVRIEMWQAALEAHAAGRARVTEARGSDYFGPGLTDTAFLGSRVVPKILAGQTITLALGGPDVPHSWTYIDDVARTLVVLGRDSRALGRAWHVPTNSARTAREMIEGLAAAAGRPTPQIRRLPGVLRRTAGLFSATVAELEETRYQFEQPFVVDSSAATATFGLRATPIEQAWASTTEWWRTAERRMVRSRELVVAG